MQCRAPSVIAHLFVSNLCDGFRSEAELRTWETKLKSAMTSGKFSRNRLEQKEQLLETMKAQIQQFSEQVSRALYC